MQQTNSPTTIAIDPSTSRVVLVVGASSGIGAATAQQLQANGWTVYAAARRIDRLQQLGAGIRPLALDVADSANVATAISQVLGEAGQIDALINCAGWGGIGALEEMPLSEARRMFEVNVFGLAEVMQQVIPHMRARGCGHIVNVASMAGRIAFPMSSWYVATKHAVVGLSASAAFELNQLGIQIAVVEPGAILTEFSDGLDASPDAKASGPYVDMLARTRKMADDIYQKSGVQPVVIAECIEAILNDPQPRLHYIEPFYAKRDVLIGNLLPARWFRKLVNWQAGL